MDEERNVKEIMTMKRMVVIFVALMFICSIASASVVFYTDITSGPNTGGENDNGCYLTIAGKGFGDTRGGSTVTIGGGEVAEYKVWSDTEISVQIGPNTQTGDIVVSVSGEPAAVVELPYRQPGNLQFTVRDANIYFISPDGDNTNPGTFDLPRTNVPGIKAVMNGGDFLYVREGSYIAEDTFGFFWLNNSDGAHDGSPGAPTVVSGYPGEVAHVTGGPLMAIRGGGHDMVYAHFVSVNGTNCSFKAYERVRVIDIDMSGMTGRSGGLNTSTGSYLYVYGCKIHSPGVSASRYTHLTYISSDRNSPGDMESDHIFFGWNELYDAGNDLTAIHFYTEQTYGADKSMDYIYVHDNLVYDIDRTGIMIGSRMKNCWIWNNVLSNCGRVGTGALGVSGVTSGHTIRIYNNTFYNSPSGHILLRADGGTTNVEIKNNIFHSTADEPYVTVLYGDWPDELISASNNLYYGAGAAYPLDANPVTGDPQFTNPALGDFSLASDSPGIDAGTSIFLVKNDIEGAIRPQGRTHDIGAYEYTSGTIPNRPPVIESVTAEPPSGEVPLPVSFTIVVVDPDGDEMTFVWTFGDGYASNEQNPTHVYNIAGMYTASVVVRDDAGATATESITVTITEEEPPAGTGKVIIKWENRRAVYLNMTDAQILALVSETLATVEYNSITIK